MADSQKSVGRKIIQDFDRNMLRELYMDDTLLEDFNNLRRRMTDINTSNSEFVAMLKLLWEYTVSRPKQFADLTSGGDKITNAVIKFIENGNESTDRSDERTEENDQS